jgi:uncharacterized protein YutE (UPF0331/DUF86 family)
MNEKALLLITNVHDDLQAIEEIYAALERYQVPDGSVSAEDEDQMIVIAYRLHNLYSAFENIFLNIARTFENQIDESGRWHTQLLSRMRLDLLPLRPSVIDKAAYRALDELLRFRHLFRHAYTVHLDPDRLRLVLQQAQQLRKLYPSQVERFLEFVRQLDS